MQTHGELPCPACGYQRRGLAHEIACPECGSRGCVGELVVSGTPAETAEARLSDRLYSLSILVPGAIAVVLAIFWGTRLRAFDPAFTRVRAIAFIAMGSLFLVGWIRRRRQKRSGLSLERCVWEFAADAVTVRDHAREVRIPRSDIREVCAQIDFVKRRTRVTLVTHGDSLGSVGLPSLLLHGPLGTQRDIMAAIKERTKNA